MTYAEWKYLDRLRQWLASAPQPPETRSPAIDDCLKRLDDFASLVSGLLRRPYLWTALDPERPDWMPPGLTIYEYPGGAYVFFDEEDGVFYPIAPPKR